MDGSRLGRMIWPEDGTRFAAIGGSVGLAGDFASFLGNIGSPKWVLAPMLLAMAVGLAACWRQVSDRNRTSTPEALKRAIDCMPCTAFRVLLFACIGIGLLAMAGEGVTATERIGTRLGLIQENVEAIRSDTGLIREDVQVVRDALSASEPAANPQTANAHFQNAWIYIHNRQDEAKGWEALQALYRQFTPNKLDAAERYHATGKLQLGADAVLEAMVAIGRQKRDAAMLVIAARATPSLGDAFELYREARAIDPDLAFAQWDLGRTDLLFYGTTKGATLRDGDRYIREEIAGLEKFLQAAARVPVARYFYKPRYQGDSEALARQQLESKRQLLDARANAARSQDQSLGRLKALRDQNAAALEGVKQR